MDHLFRSSGERRTPAEFIIPGLDVETVTDARRLVKLLSPVCDTFKIGKHFILDPEWSSFLTEYFGPDSNLSIFLDLKDFDIGESSKLFAKQVYNHPAIDFFTVHAVRQTMEAAISQRSLGTNVLAVPLLTSFGPAELKEFYNWDIAFDGPILDFFLRKTEIAFECGCEGIVCSPEEVRPVREEFGYGYYIVVPGSRPPGTASDDHQRTGTPAQAILDGADYVVLSRSIIHAPDPRAAFEEIADGIGRVI